MNMSDLSFHVQNTPLMDTHEHLNSEQQYVENGPDVLQTLFDHYAGHDLLAAGATTDALNTLLDASNPDIEQRWAGIVPAWDAIRHTGYGEAVRIVARELYGMEDITPEAITNAASTHQRLRQPGECLRILRDKANLDHVQIDDFSVVCLPDAAGPDFFLYDLSWASFANGVIDAPGLYRETGIEVRDLDTLDTAMAALFARYGPVAIAVKSQHAYQRTLHWQPRERGDAARALARVLRGEGVSADERLCLGDWCLARGAALAAEYNLPFKIHTGYYAGNSVSPVGSAALPVDYIKPGQLGGLLAQYPQTRFVLMHIAYPYSDELLAVAKYFPNVYVDLCWAWSINPYTAADFVRRFIHSVPANKLFAFGGDTLWPGHALAYARQARNWLIHALQAEIDDGLLTESQAVRLATRFMRDNQKAVFDLDGTRAAIRAGL